MPHKAKINNEDIAIVRGGMLTGFDALVVRLTQEKGEEDG